MKLETKQIVKLFSPIEKHYLKQIQIFKGDTYGKKEDLLSTLSEIKVNKLIEIAQKQK